MAEDKLAELLAEQVAYYRARAREYDATIRSLTAPTSRLARGSRRRWRRSPLRDGA